jgi:cyclophilin family peptidyl-prolyl cis-trans isomerase
MTTTTPEPQSDAETPWWERLTEASGDTEASKGLLRLVVIAALIGAVAIFAFIFFKGSKEEALNARSAILTKAQEALPQASLDPFNPPAAAYTPQTAGVLLSYERGTGSAWDRSLPSASIADPEAAAEFLKKARGEIATLEEKKSDFEGSDQEYMYWHTLQALHFYAARNSSDLADVKKHLGAQTEILDKIDQNFGDHAFFSLCPNTDKPNMTVAQLWREMGKKELSFHEKSTAKVNVAADENLKATLTLADGKTLELEFYSRVAPKSVASFVANAKGGFYDGTAVSRIDTEAKTITFGNLMTKLAADRPFLWDRTTDFYNVPAETNLHLPVTKGSVALRLSGSAANGFEFEIYLEEPEGTINAPVFAKVTSGLEALRPYLENELHSFEKLANQALPKARIELSSVAVTGEPQFSSLDATWKPKPKAPAELPDASADEEAFMKSLEEGSGDENEGENAETNTDEGDK